MARSMFVGALLLALGMTVTSCAPAGGPAGEGAPGRFLAAASTPPSSACADVADRGERMKCRLDRLTAEGTRTAEVLASPPWSGLLSPAQREGVERARARLQHQRARVRPEELKALTRKRDSACQPVECDPDLHPGCAPVDGDGICGPGEDCLELLRDGVGDDVQPCSPMHGNRREECVLTCEDAAVCREETNLDDDLTAELEGAYDDVTASLGEVNAALPEVAPAVRSLLTAQVGTDPCALDADGLSRQSHILVATARLSAVGARGVADIAERICDQEAFGFNCASCCAPFETAAGLLAVASELVSFMEGNINSATIDAAFACVGALNAAVNGQVAQLEELERGLDRIDAVQAEVIRLLNTPPGVRPLYPVLP